LLDEIVYCSFGEQSDIARDALLYSSFKFARYPVFDNCVLRQEIGTRIKKEFRYRR
jgi:hypothetical protein